MLLVGGGEGHAVDAQADVGVDPRSGLAGAPLTGLHTRAGVVPGVAKQLANFGSI